MVSSSVLFVHIDVPIAMIIFVTQWCMYLVVFRYTSSFLVVVAMIGPFIASVGLILIIPIGFIVDYVMHHWVPSEETTLVLALQMAGCVAIVIGFAMLQWASKVTGKHRRRCGNAHKYCECIIW